MVLHHAQIAGKWQIMRGLRGFILLPSADSFKKGCCHDQLQTKYVHAQSTGLLFVQACPGKSLVRHHDHSCLLGRKATTKPTLFVWQLA